MFVNISRERNQIDDGGVPRSHHMSVTPKGGEVPTGDIRFGFFFHTHLDALDFVDKERSTRLAHCLARTIVSPRRSSPVGGSVSSTDISPLASEPPPWATTDSR